MADERPDMTLKAIGFVRNEIKRPMREGWEKVVSEIVVENNLTDALDDLEEFSHITVIFWMHLVDTSVQLPHKVHPMGRGELPLVGLFATRSPHRPNPLGETTVRLLKRRANVLTVEGLDAVDGTPVIDIKPYLQRYDSTTNPRVAPWVTNQ
ncbi:MAG: tRNA (N6-threonylcarbamoyladenosine(37)-N6)-methyltransferase TrmO [Chloroflexi bacterium]|nr:tRNA (N6-threonylcarbamoyladenosine(37)-N6)-methyltransferase TrmO [Chloroflexota bacterium]